MIETKLDVKDYCENCKMLTPCTEVHRYHMYAGRPVTQIFITCKHEEYCENLSKHFGGEKAVGN